ncbi:hypothetical protein A3A67_01890 [Candidatus Peribacteria bacterium RIFCSPLOWO2_01_FULL_51_18]|nr:MAG: hypothetical protein A3A67_01890 [Candidatus Peribacteria bacterium RIFCSPLOWO2_01_FULL_51_18]
MRPNPYLKRGLKYATLALTLLAAVLAAAAFYKNNSSGLAGRLVPPSERGIVPSKRYEAWRAKEGFAAPADVHVIFTVPEDVARITRITFMGGPDTDQQRYWGYCYSGREDRNKAEGKTGKDMYDGRFFYSMGERIAQAKRPAADNDLTAILRQTEQKPDKKASIAEIFSGGDTCYVMSSVILPIGIDTDNDDINNVRERAVGTSPVNPDTDSDGIPDGKEVFLIKTNPLDRDSDRDGLGDGCEEANQNGKVDALETSPLNPDTDRDGLCDGNGSGPGCPEPKKKECYRDPAEDALVCRLVVSSPVYGEDMNQNCKQDKDETNPKKGETFGIPDWEYKYRKIGSPNINPGTPAPEFPIPNIPPRH